MPPAAGAAERGRIHFAPAINENGGAPTRRKPGGEQFAYYCWAVGLGSLVAGIVKFGILA